MKAVSMKLSDMEFDALVELVARGKHGSVSSALRKGIELLLISHKVKAEVLREIREGRLNRHSRHIPRAFKSEGRIDNAKGSK